MVFFTVHKSKKIISDAGYIKYELFLFGLFLFFLSLNFNKFSNYSSCVLNFVTKHCGILMIYIIFLIFISVAYRLGIDYRNKDYALNNIINNSIISGGKLDEFNSSENINIDDKNNNKSSIIRESVIYKIELEMNRNIEIGITKDTSMKSLKSQNDEKNQQSSMKKMNKNIYYIHSLYIELTTIYILFCVVFITLISLYSFSKETYIQEDDGRWRYDCPLNYIDFTMNFIEFFMILYLFALELKIQNYSFIFKFTKNISISSIIMISLGPLTNVILI